VGRSALPTSHVSVFYSPGVKASGTVTDSKDSFVDTVVLILHSHAHSKQNLYLRIAWYSATAIVLMSLVTLRVNRLARSSTGPLLNSRIRRTISSHLSTHIISKFDRKDTNHDDEYFYKSYRIAFDESDWAEAGKEAVAEQRNKKNDTKTTSAQLRKDSGLDLRFRQEANTAEEKQEQAMQHTSSASTTFLRTLHKVRRSSRTTPITFSTSTIATGFTGKAYYFPDMSNWTVQQEDEYWQKMTDHYHGIQAL
jgi:hypothetical protein